MATRTQNPEHKAMLASMAATWETLATEREEHLARRQRIAALETRAGATTADP